MCVMQGGMGMITAWRTMEKEEEDKTINYGVDLNFTRTIRFIGDPPNVS